MKVSGRTFSLQFLSLVAICLFPILAISVYAHPITIQAPNLESTQEWLPVVPPEPREVPDAVDPTAAVEFNVMTGEEFHFPSVHPSQQPVETGLSSTPSYEGLFSAGVTPESVFPPDDRSLIQWPNTESFPYRTIAKIYFTANDGTQWTGSASIIGPSHGHGYHVLTAGHCVYIHDHGGWISSMKVIPGFDGAQTPGGHRTPYNYAWVTYIRTYAGWTNDSDTRHDWAVCTLDRNIGDYTGWMGRITTSPSDPVYTGSIRTAGYPGDLSMGLRMYDDQDVGRTADEYVHWYYMDTAGGQSGSPVWVYYHPEAWHTLSVHTSGDDGSGSNHGTRLDQDKFDRIITWLDSDTPPPDKADLADDGEAYRGFQPATVTAGSTSFSVWCDVRNFGTQASSDFYVAYYASVDTVISPSDYLIGTDHIMPLSPTHSADSGWNGIFPSTVPEGEYFVGWIIDSTDVVNEFDETNNEAYHTSLLLTVLHPKYSITFYTDPSTVGSIKFDDTTYAHGQSGLYIAGDYTVFAISPAGWTFDHWITTGGVSISDSTATVTGTGSIKAVFTSTPTFNIWTDKTTYNIGDTMKVYVRVKNPGPALSVRAIITVKLPSGSTRNLLNSVVALPASYDSGDYLWSTFAIPSAPAGYYAWEAELRDPDTGAFISQSMWIWQLLP